MRNLLFETLMRKENERDGGLTGSTGIDACVAWDADSHECMMI